MFTDCKKTTSEDLFLYLLLIGVLDHNFTNRVINIEEMDMIRKISEEYLGKNPNIYSDFE